MSSFDGQVVLVTGGGTGIGRAVALAAAERGAHVVIAGRRSGPLEQTTFDAEATGLRMTAAELDVTDSDSVRDVVDGIIAAHGRLDGVVNAAGVAAIARSEDFHADEFLRVLDINLAGAFRVSREAARHMLPAGRGSIVHIGSLTSLGGFPGRAAYSASKHGVVGLTRTLGAEWGASGVRVNAVAPGFVRTPMTDAAFERGLLDLNAIESRTPIRRRAEPEEMVGPVLFLLSDEASYVNGETLVADGGWRAYLGPITDMAAPRHS